MGSLSHDEEEEVEKSVWFVDSGCSNHMSGTKSLFRDLDETQKRKISLGDNKKIQVEGRGTVAMKINSGKIKLINNVLFSPDLAHNLLSVGQLMKNGHSILFDDGVCLIKEKKTGYVVAKVHMTKNFMFPLQPLDIVDQCFVTHNENTSMLWHLRYGHLNFSELKLLNQHEMVLGLPQIEDKSGVCEGCMYGKHSKRPFPSGKAWRATTPLELIHVDLCGPMNTKSLGGSKYFFY